MTNEELILERLERIEAQVSPLAESARSFKELKDDLMMIAHPVSKMLIKELQEVESSFQLEDLMVLTKRFLRSVNDLTFALNQLENIVDFVTTIEPLLKKTVPQLIDYLDRLEQRGVFRIINATLDIRAKVASAYTPEDIDRIGDGLVALLGLAQKVTDPKAIAILMQLAELPAKVDLEASREVGPWGLFSACSTRDVKKGLGVLLELTRAMGALKKNGEALALDQVRAARSE